MMNLNKRSLERINMIQMRVVVMIYRIINSTAANINIWTLTWMHMYIIKIKQMRALKMKLNTSTTCHQTTKVIMMNIETIHETYYQTKLSGTLNADLHNKM